MERFPISEGMFPWKVFSEMSNITKFDILRMAGESVPVNAFPPRVRLTIADIFQISPGIVPEKLFLLKNTLVRERQRVRMGRTSPSN